MNGPSFCIKLSSFPCGRKKAIVQDVDNHRGICLIPVFSRLLAKVIASRLSDFCEREQVIDEGQWGFMASHIDDWDDWHSSTPGGSGHGAECSEGHSSSCHRASRHEEGLPEQQQKCLPTCIGL